MSQKILVTGATGTIGKALVKALHAKGAPFVAGVRNQQKASEILGSEIHTVPFDFEDSTTYAIATEGISKVFLLGPPLRTDLDTLLLPFIQHLKASGIKQVVYVAALGLEAVKELPFHTNVINVLKQEGFDFTILKPTFFAQNFKNYEWDNIMQRGVVFVPGGNGKTAFVDVHDIAASAAAVLTTEGHTGRTYSLTGPELFSYAEAAQLLSEITGRTIVYPQPSPEEFAGALKAAGAPDFIASYMNAVYSLLRDQKVELVSDDVEKLTGQKPASLQEVLERDFAVVPA